MSRKRRLATVITATTLLLGASGVIVGPHNAAQAHPCVAQNPRTQCTPPRCTDDGVHVHLYSDGTIYCISVKVTNTSPIICFGPGCFAEE